MFVEKNLVEVLPNDYRINSTVSNFLNCLLIQVNVKFYFPTSSTKKKKLQKKKTNIVIKKILFDQCKKPIFVFLLCFKRTYLHEKTNLD